MIASSWMDPVLGVDMHWEMVPTPAPVPMPFPHPYIGIVVDVGGLAGAMVMNAAMSAVFGAPFTGPVIHWFTPATNTGTNSKHIPGHFIIPPGTIWAPVPRTPKPKIHPGETPVPAPPIKPENDAISIVGSQTVHIGGSNGVRLGDMFMSCSEPVRLPSSVVLAIPKGAPILIGGPPGLDLMAAVMASLKTRFVSDSLHALVSRLAPGRFRNLLNRVVCFFTGHPVDVASGKVMTSSVDVELPGPLPLRIERVYSSAFGDRDGPLGYGWSLSLDQAIWTERGKVVLLAEDGREIEFDAFDLPEHRMKPGDRLWHPIDRLELECLAEGRWMVHEANGDSREFGPVPGGQDGRAMIQRIRSRCRNHEIAFEYDKAGRLEWVRDACGRLVWLERDERGRVTKLKLPLPKGDGFYVHRAYAYDRRGDLAQVTDALQHSWRFEYVTHLLVRETDRTGLSFYFEYDGLGQDAWCTRTWGDGGIYDHKLAYDKVKKVTFVTDSLGHTTQYHMNLAGLVVKVVDPLGGETRHQYDPRTLQETDEIDALGNARHWEFDPRGNCTRAVEADGATVIVDFDPQGRAIRKVDPGGGEWRWEYGSPSGRLPVREVDPRGVTTEYRLHAGLVREVVHPAGARTSFEYDRQKNRTVLRGDDGAETRFWHDALGRLVKTTNARGGKRTARHDVLGRIVEVREPDGNVRQLEYDPEGNVTAYRDLWREGAYGYTGLHKLARQEEGGAQLRMEYDTEDRPAALVNEKGERHCFVRDERGLVVEEVGFAGGIWRYRRDAAGRVIQERRPSGALSTVAYDPAGRVASVSYADGTSEEFGYFPDGALRWASNESGKVEFERNERGQVTAERRGEHVIRSRYGLDGWRESLDSTLGARQVALREPWGGLTRLVAGPCELSFERDPLGAELERKMPGGLTLRWERDAAGRPTSRRLASTTASLGSRSFVWEPGDRLTETSDSTHGRTRYRHDRRGWLVEAEFADGGRQQRIPDPAGNLHRAPLLDDRTFGPGGRLLRTGGTSCAYDADGNLVEKRSADGSTWRYMWNGAGRLRQVQRPDGLQVTFAYDALGRRVSKRVGDAEVRFVWDGDVVLHELHGGEDPTTWYFEPETFAPLLKEQGGRRYAVVTDHVGTPTELYDEGGTLAWQMQLDAYGAGEPEVAATSCPWRWPGQYEDPETGLYYNRFRYYDPDAGSYISQDPIGLAGDTNPYAYVRCPLSELDPQGLMPWAWNPTKGMGHHLVPRGKANSVGLTLLGTKRNTPTFFPTPYVKKMHEALHAAQAPHIGALQGPWNGTAGELLAASRAGLDDVAHLRGELRIPATGEVLARDVTPTEAFDKLMQWHEEQKAKRTGGCK
jgi:RHS repeat-associated protein